MSVKEKGKCGIFLKRTDMFSAPIGPTFNGLKNYPTKVGGVLTIVTGLLLLMWTAVQVFDIWVYKKGTTTVSKASIYTDDSLANPVWKINSKQMIVAN